MRTTLITRTTTLFILFVFFLFPIKIDAASPIKTPQMPTEINGGAWSTSHVQGFAIDQKKKYMYFSFTQMLVKTDLQGNVVGTVEGITGHLGDIEFNPKDGRVYGSLEYKAAEKFYIAIFDGDKITRTGMDAETDGVMTAVYLQEVADDFIADMDGNGKFDGDTAATLDHRYGCSGIDGVSFGPEFGKKNGAQKLMVAYGIYSNTEREDNDHQVILQYDVNKWKKYERTLSQSEPHASGPASPEAKYFVYTGNTTFGVQNLEYDADTNNWFMAVYKGHKEKFPNYSMFIIDGTKKPVKGVIRGQSEPEEGLLLSLLKDGLYDEATGIYGWEFSGWPILPQYGLESVGNGYFYVAHTGTFDGKQTGKAVLHKWTSEIPTPFERVQ